MTRGSLDRSWPAVEDLRRQRVRGHGAHPYLIPLTVLIGEPQDLTRLDTQAGPKMVAEITRQRDFLVADLR